MINAKLVDYTQFTDINILISDIDCKLTELSKKLYNNTIFALNQKIQTDVYFDLLQYRRILVSRLCNPLYAIQGCDCTNVYTIDKIASKVKLLKYK